MRFIAFGGFFLRWAVGRSGGPCGRCSRSRRRARSGRNIPSIACCGWWAGGGASDIRAIPVATPAGSRHGGGHTNSVDANLDDKVWQDWKYSTNLAPDFRPLPGDPTGLHPIERSPELTPNKSQRQIRQGRRRGRRASSPQPSPQQPPQGRLMTREPKFRPRPKPAGIAEAQGGNAAFHRPRLGNPPALQMQPKHSLATCAPTAQAPGALCSGPPQGSHERPDCHFSPRFFVSAALQEAPQAPHRAHKVLPRALQAPDRETSSPAMSAPSPQRTSWALRGALQAPHRARQALSRARRARTGPTKPCNEHARFRRQARKARQAHEWALQAPRRASPGLAAGSIPPAAREDSAAT